MIRSKYSESQIVFAIKQVDTGTRIQEVCRKMGVSEATFYNWKNKYGGLAVSEIRRLKNLEEEEVTIFEIVLSDKKLILRLVRLQLTITMKERIKEFGLNIITQ